MKWKHFYAVFTGRIELANLWSLSAAHIQLTHRDKHFRCFYATNIKQFPPQYFIPSSVSSKDLETGKHELLMPHIVTWRCFLFIRSPLLRKHVSEYVASSIPCDYLQGKNAFTSYFNVQEVSFTLKFFRILTSHMKRLLVSLHLKFWIISN